MGRLNRHRLRQNIWPQSIRVWRLGWIKTIGPKLSRSFFQWSGHGYMDASENSRFSPKSSFLIGFSIIFTIHFWGTTIFGNTHIAPINGRKYMGNWGYNLYKFNIWSWGESHSKVWWWFVRSHDEHVEPGNWCFPKEISFSRSTSFQVPC